MKVAERGRPAAATAAALHSTWRCCRRLGDLRSCKAFCLWSRGQRAAWHEAPVGGDCGGPTERRPCRTARLRQAPSRRTRTHLERTVHFFAHVATASPKFLIDSTQVLLTRKLEGWKINEDANFYTEKSTVMTTVLWLQPIQLTRLIHLT